MNAEADIKALLTAGHTDEAIRRLHDLLAEVPQAASRWHYLLGNAHRKAGQWAQALYHYAEAEALNPQSPAASARRMLMDILNFYHKDMYNP